MNNNKMVPENISEAEHNEEEDDDEELNNSQKPFEENLYPKSLSNQSNNVIFQQ